MSDSERVERKRMLARQRQARRRERARSAVLAVKKAYRQRHSERLSAEATERHRADPAKHLARQRLLYAVRTGKVTRPEVCERAAADGCLGRIEAHHRDYANALDVTWLCQRHHVAEHRATLAA